MNNTCGHSTVITKQINGYIRPNFYFDENQILSLRKFQNITAFLLRKIIGGFHDYKKELNEFKKRNKDKEVLIKV